MSKASVGKRVKRALEARGMGYNELDRALGKDQGYTSRLIKNDRKPRSDNVQALAMALGVSYEWLLSGDGDMVPVDGTSPDAGPGAHPAPGAEVPGARRRWVERAEPYPARAQVLVMARDKGYPDAVLTALATGQYKDAEPNATSDAERRDFWWAELKELAREFAREPSWRANAGGGGPRGEASDSTEASADERTALARELVAGPVEAPAGGFSIGAGGFWPSDPAPVSEPEPPTTPSPRDKGGKAPRRRG